MFVAVVLVYLVCWLPHWIIQLFLNFEIGDVPKIYVLYASCLAYLNSAINPLLYAFLTTNFFNRLNEILAPLDWPCAKRSANTDI